MIAIHRIKYKDVPYVYYQETFWKEFYKLKSQELPIHIKWIHHKLENFQRSEVLWVTIVTA